MCGWSSKFSAVIRSYNTGPTAAARRSAFLLAHPQAGERPAHHHLLLFSPRRGHEKPAEKNQPETAESALDEKGKEPKPDQQEPRLRPQPSIREVPDAEPDGDTRKEHGAETDELGGLSR